MDLKDFVSDVLTEIAEGIALAQEKSEGKYRISPTHVSQHPKTSDHMEYTNDALECVEFDIAITSKNIVNGKIETGVFVVGGNVHGKNEQENISRVKFPVYVAWPRQR